LALSNRFDVGCNGLRIRANAWGGATEFSARG